MGQQSRHSGEGTEMLEVVASVELCHGFPLSIVKKTANVLTY